MALKCPHCQALVEPTLEKGSGEISTNRGAVIRANFDEDTGEYIGKGKQPYRGTFDLEGGGFSIFKCPNCRKNFVGQYRRVVWPLPDIPVPEELPRQIQIALIDAKKAHAVEADIAALLAARTTIVRMQRDLHVASLKELRENGRITEVLYRQADEVRLWANAFGHEDVPDMVEPADVDQLLTYLDILLDAVYVQPARLAALQAKRP